MDLRSVLYEIEGRVATITLNRPGRLNAIDAHMPAEVRRAVEEANADPAVHVIVLTGAGRAFSAGYDLKEFAEAAGPNPGVQAMPWDPTVDYAMMARNTDDFMSLWRSPKPTIAKVRGHAVAGGSDIALCCDLIVIAEDARIGYPPARVWGVPTTAMWVYRLGAERAKRMLLTGDLIDGREAARIGLVGEAVPEAELDARVRTLAARIAAVPRNQLVMNKMVVNQAYENMGLSSTQRLATFFDGVARHSPEGLWFKERAETVGFKQAVAERDGGEPIAPGVRRR
jgi:enoyl-CoA hydratase